jgi:hypothetical protein
MAKVSLTAGVDAKLAAKVVEQAEQAGIPLSTVVVERALAQYLERPKEPKRPARSGRVATVQTIKIKIKISGRARGQSAPSAARSAQARSAPGHADPRRSAGCRELSAWPRSEPGAPTETLSRDRAPLVQPVIAAVLG